MARIRTITQAIDEIKNADPDTAVTAYYIRQLVRTRAIPHISAGSKVLIDLDVLLDYIAEQFAE